MKWKTLKNVNINIGKSIEKDSSYDFKTIKYNKCKCSIINNVNVI